MPVKHLIFPILLISSLIACKSSDDSPSSSTEYKILMMGNSHSELSDLPQKIERLIEAGTGKSVYIENAPSWKFLDERLIDGVSENTLNSKQWTHVILQAQKYSTTGNFSYPITPSIEWIKKVKQRNAVPIMFPEWEQKNNIGEGERVHNLHLTIVTQEPACLAPVGLAWTNARLQYPNLNLHHIDGNHSNPTGALLTAYVIYETITGNQARNLQFVNGVSASAEIQNQLKEIASLTIEQNPACQYYPYRKD